MPHSHHSHSGQFCAHAQGSLEDVIKTAIAKGFTTYGLSEHVPRHKNSDLYPEEIEAGLKPEDLRSRFDAYIMEAHRLREVYYDKINLLIGLETEYISSVDLDALESLLAQYGQRIDYVVGSIHHVANIPIDFDRATYERAVAAHDGTNEQASIDSFLSAYFDAQYHMLLRIKPEVVGHVDLCRLYEPVLKLQDYPDAWDKLARNIQFVVDYGGLFEFNAAALRKGWPGAYPGEDVVRLIQKYGGRFVLSDDSHGPQGVGLNYSRMRDYLLALGIDEIHYLRKTDAPNHAGRYVEAMRIEEDWKAHKYWDGHTTV